MQRPAVQLDGVGDLDHAPQVHHGDAVAHLAHDAQVMGDKQVDEAALLLQAPPDLGRGEWRAVYLHRLGLVGLRGWCATGSTVWGGCVMLRPKRPPVIRVRGIARRVGGGLTSRVLLRGQRGKGLTNGTVGDGRGGAGSL